MPERWVMALFGIAGLDAESSV